MSQFFEVSVQNQNICLPIMKLSLLSSIKFGKRKNMSIIRLKHEHISMVYNSFPSGLYDRCYNTIFQIRLSILTFNRRNRKVTQPTTVDIAMESSTAKLAERMATLGFSTIPPAELATSTRTYQN